MSRPCGYELYEMPALPAAAAVLAACPSLSLESAPLAICRCSVLRGLPVSLAASEMETLGMVQSGVRPSAIWQWGFIERLVNASAT
jgi:hypothetical protein